MGELVSQNLKTRIKHLKSNNQYQVPKKRASRKWDSKNAGH